MARPSGAAGGSEPVADVYAVLVNAKGEQLYDPSTGEPAMVSVPPVLLRHNPGHMITQKEAAERPGMHRATIERAVKKGELVRHDVGGRHPRIKKEGLDNWIAGKSVAAKR